MFKVFTSKLNYVNFWREKNPGVFEYEPDIRIFTEILKQESIHYLKKNLSQKSFSQVMRFAKKKRCKQLGSVRRGKSQTRKTKLCQMRQISRNLLDLNFKSSLQIQGPLH